MSNARFVHPAPESSVLIYLRATVFNGLRSDVSTVRDYQGKVRTQSSGLQATQMDQLVASYRY